MLRMIQILAEFSKKIGKILLECVAILNAFFYKR